MPSPYSDASYLSISVCENVPDVMCHRVNFVLVTHTALKWLAFLVHFQELSGTLFKPGDQLC
jgi:hypothetical protein